MNIFFSPTITESAGAIYGPGVKTAGISSKCSLWDVEDQETPASSHRGLYVLCLRFTYITIIQHSLWLLENMLADKVWRGQ